MAESTRSWRVLLVDDDPMVLRLLDAIMRRAGKGSYQVTACERASEALAELERRRYDVVISDLDMPLMSGATLLQEVERRFPDTLRLIHSGSAPNDHTLASMTVTHQFIGKPSPPDTLAQAVQRVCAMRQTLRADGLQRLIGRVGSLPSVPSLYLELVEELESPEPSLQRAGEIVASDVAMTAKILQLVNSTLFGLRCRVHDPVHATAILGLRTIRTLVLALEVFSRFEGAPATRRHIEQLWRHSMNTAATARAIANAEGCDRELAEQCFLAGVLHDVGKLVLWSELPKDYLAIHEEALATQEELCTLERRRLGGNHAQVGAYLLTLWGFPPAIVGALAWHHDPAGSGNAELRPLALVHAANAIDHAAAGEAATSLEAHCDNRYLAALGLDQRLAHWAELHPEALTLRRAS